MLMSLSSVVIKPARTIEGLVRIPGDKSISHRYAMLAAIAEGTSRFHNFSVAQDCGSTLGCIAALGASSRRVEDGAVEVVGIGRELKAPASALACRSGRAVCVSVIRVRFAGGCSPRTTRDAIKPGLGRQRGSPRNVRPLELDTRSP